MNLSSNFLNYGTLFNRNFDAITITSTNSYIENHGTISGDSTLAVINAYGALDARGLHLLNYGTILASGFNEASGILTNSAGNYIENHGNLSATNDSALEIYDGANTGFGNTIVNTGTISTGSSYAISISGSGRTQLYNSGDILGSIQIGNARLSNSGTIDGSVSINGDLVNSGDILGVVQINYSDSTTVRNSGLIAGPLTLSGQNAAVFNTGVVQGDLSVGGLFATIDLRGGTVLGNVYGT